MDKNQRFHTSHLFTVRLWREELVDDSSEVRCQVRYVMSGETRYFRDWSQLVAYLQDKFQELEKRKA